MSAILSILNPPAETSQPAEVQTYRNLPLEELAERTSAAKQVLGDRVIVLGHNYQRDEVIRHADIEGDSLKLSQIAAERSSHEHIIFCGVHFMAETADILSKTAQTVILPDPAITHVSQFIVMLIVGNFFLFAFNQHNFAAGILDDVLE